jgi:uncharacterized protein (TIGR00299 family) protein
MPRVAYVDCFSGASGDMLLGALLDAGLPLDALRAGLDGLPIEGWHVDAEPASQHGLGGTRALVRLDQADAPHRGLRAIEAILRTAVLPDTVVERALGTFRRLGEVEATIHDVSVDEIEFHEVGALDAIVDVVGVVLGLHLLQVETVLSSGLPLGSGWVRSAHGPLPVPAPATLALLQQAGAPSRGLPPIDRDSGELTTPTAAALLTTLARFQTSPPSFAAVERVGYGFGRRELPWPNAVRLLIGQPSSDPSLDLERDSVVAIETNLDDSTPEELGFAMEQLLGEGALDVAFSPLQMKKNRPGVLVRVLARPADATRLAELLLVSTSALGVRFSTLDRLIARRSEATVTTPWGPVRIKVKQVGGRAIGAPEYEDCARLARAHQLPLRAVFATALRAFEDDDSG